MPNSTPFTLQLEESCRKKDRMRVAIVARGVYPTLKGGVEIHVHFLTRHLSRYVDVIIIHEGKLQSGIESTLSLSNRIEFNRRVYILTTILKAMWKVLMIRPSPDVVHAQTASIPLVIGFVLSRVSGAPLVVTCHGSEIRLWGRTTYLKYLQRMILGRCKSIICTSDEIRRILNREYGLDLNRMDVIPNGHPDTSDLRYRYKPVVRRLVAVSSLRVEKGPMTLLRAMRLIREWRPPIKLVWAGDGPLRNQMEAYIASHRLQSRVELLGNLPHQRVLEVLTDADIFVISSQHEGLPTALVEAMSIGLPVVATDAGGISELVEDGVTGFLVERGSSRAIGDMVLKLANDYELRISMGKAAKSRVKDLSWESIAKKHLVVYEKAIEHESR